MITISTKIHNVPELTPVKRAAAALMRDIRNTCQPGKNPGMNIRLQTVDLPTEAYKIVAGQEIVVCAGDALGFVYGLYRISHDILGVEPFWFWNDQPLKKAAGYPVPAGWTAKSKPCAVRYRGWFVNDEVLLNAWYLDGSKDKPWEMVFEALLRLGGNLVIPGTDRNAHKYDTLAADFGLYITHHHAEPLGARMFLRAYPDLTPAYSEHPDLFEGLWQEAVDKQKSRPTVYNLGFRGQGDRPFWTDDPQFATPESRGRLMSALIRKQYDLVKASIPDAPCCTNLYGETMELYQQGHLDLPEDVIKIWADNGFGKMVTRRQNNHNPRIRALPQEGASGAHGLYYHASFYDLQAASQMTMLPNPPEFVRRELTEALSLGVKDYWIINCSNVKPHVYTLDLIAALWRDGDVDTEQHLLDYCARYYDAENAELAAKGKEQIVSNADVLLDQSTRTGYFLGFGSNFFWGSNMNVANQGELLYMAEKVTGDAAYGELAKHQLDYLLGTNALGYCFVTGYGTFSPENPHHRPSQVAGQAASGMLVGGPNKNLEDPYAIAVLTEESPATSYVDNVQSYSTNEVAIYWNSPLIYLLAAEQ